MKWRSQQSLKNISDIWILLEDGGILCHNFTQRSSGSRDIRLPDLSSVKIAIVFISQAESVFKLTVG